MWSQLYSGNCVQKVRLWFGKHEKPVGCALEGRDLQAGGKTACHLSRRKLAAVCLGLYFLLFSL